eukprot:4832409-Amphidinium_carterae.1
MIVHDLFSVASTSARLASFRKAGLTSPMNVQCGMVTLSLYAAGSASASYRLEHNCLRTGAVPFWRRCIGHAPPGLLPGLALYKT